MKRFRTFGVAVLAVLVATACYGQDAPKQMTVGEHVDMDPMIAPNGDLLAFSSNRTGNFDIWVYDYSTKTLSQVTQSEKDDRYPSWARDSKRILFTSRRTGKGDIYETKFGGGAGNLQLTVAENLEEYASYHPSGTGMVFARSQKRGILRRKMDVVFTEKPTSASLAQMVVNDADEPRFSPDGKKVVFVSRRTKNNDIWMTDLKGGMNSQLTSSPKDDENPSFSPDGKHIVFAANRTGNYDLWVMDTDGSNVRQLTSDAADERQPCWSPGGYIYYTREMGEMKSNIWRIEAPK
jgi:Tol biopolymer transport system component